MARRWKTAMRKDGSGMVYMWTCGEKDYEEAGECLAKYVNPPKGK